MTETVRSNAPRVAVIINVILMVIIGLLIFLVFAFLALAALSLFPNGTRDTALQQLQNNGYETITYLGITWNALSAAIMAGAYLYVALVVRRIVKTTLNGDPFVTANINRLRKTWMVIAFVEIFRVIVTRTVPNVGEAASNSIGNFSIDTRLSAWFLVFVIATMAEVFRIGLELRRDQELTV